MNEKKEKPQFLSTLERDGYVVIPAIIPPSSCTSFITQAWSWLESFPNNHFSHTDPTTWTADHLPYGQARGLYNRYSVNHENFVWKIRTEPGILEIFAQIWSVQPKDLIASFDGINVSLPVDGNNDAQEQGKEQTGTVWKRKDIAPTQPWPHIDQDPRTVERLELYQGIANLAPNGPEDGGLVVLKGSHKLHQRHFESLPGGTFRAEKDLGVGENGYNFSAEDADWYRRVGGCEEVKICAEAGDLILWDSRTIHWNCSPTGERTRFVAYVCYCPREWMTEEELRRKKEVFDARKGTTHWPNMNVVPADRPNYHYAKPRRPDDSLDPANRTRPFHEPDVTPEVLRLVGARA